MAGFPPRFGTGMSPMAGTQPVAPTPTLPGLQPPMGGVPPVGAPIPLNSSNSGIAGYGGSSSGRDKFSKYLQKMNTTAPLSMNRGGPVRMREGGMVQQQFLPPMNLGRPHQFGGFGGYGGNNMHLGLQGGIQGALQPLRNHISQQIQQQTDQQINPFIDGVANDARETFDLQQDQLMSVNPMQPQPAYPQLAGLGLGIQQATNIPFNGNMMNRGFPDTTKSVGPFPPNVAMPIYGNRGVPFNQGGAVPRQTMIEDQPHMLAYIDPQERSMLEQMGGSGQPGPGGVPAYARRDGPGSENFGAEARDFRDELDRQEAEQNRNDADDRAAAEAALRAATEQRIAAQYPSADEIEVMNTAGYDKEPTQYPTASRDSYAGFGGGQLFSNRGGLEQPFSRDNRPMTNLGNPASDFLNAESAEGTFANTGGTSSIFDDGARDRMLNIFGGNTVNAGTGGISIPQFSSSNFTGDDGYLESSDVGYLGGSSIAGGSDIDPVTARNDLAKRMRSLDDLALARSKLGFPERTDALSSSGAYVDSMGKRISDNRALPDDMLFAAPQEFKNRSFPDFNFDVSDPNTRGILPRSSNSSGLTSGLMTGDPFAPTKDSRGYMPYNPETDDFVRDDMSVALANADMNTARPTFAFQDENFGRDSDVTDFRDYSGLNDSNLSMYNDLDTPSTPLPSNAMFGTADLANQTPTSTGFGFDEDGEGFDSSVMYSDLSEAELEQLSLDGDEGASNALRARIDNQNARELDAFERDRASKGFSTRPATSMAPPRDDVFSVGSRGSSGLTSEPLSGDPFPPTRDAMGYIPPTPYDASFPTEPAFSTIQPTLAGLAESGNVSAAGLNFAELQKRARAAELERIIAEASMKPRPDESMYGAGMENQLNINRANKLAEFRAAQDNSPFSKKVSEGFRDRPAVSLPITPNDVSGQFVNSDLGDFDNPPGNYDDADLRIVSPFDDRVDFDEEGELLDSSVANISKDYIKSLEKQFTTLQELGKFDDVRSGRSAGEISYGDVLNRVAYDTGAIDQYEDFDKVDQDGEKIYYDVNSPFSDGDPKYLERYAETLREYIDDANAGRSSPEGLYTNIDFDRDGELRDFATYLGDPVDPMGIGDPAGSFEAINEINADLYEEEAVTDINSELGTFDLDSIAEEAYLSDDFVFPDDEVIKLENLINDKTLDKTTKKIVDKSKDEAGDNLYYKVLDELNKGNYPEETKKELLERLRAGIRNQGWVRDAVSLGSKAHPVLFLVDKLMIGLVKKDMKEQADLLDGDKRGYLKDGQTATAVRIQKGRHKGKYVGVVIKDAKGNIVEYKGHSVMPNQFDNKDPLYDYILGEGFKDSNDNDDSPAPNDPCPAGYVLSGGVCVPVQNVGEDDETTEDDTTEDDTSDDETPTETLDEIIARIRQPSRVPTEPTETFKPITFAKQGGAMGVDPLTSGAVTDSLASATQRFLSSLTG